MSQQLQAVEKSRFSFEPTSLDEAMKYAELISKSSFCPKDMKDKPGDVLVAIQMGQEVGLKPLQALQNIAVINGRPSIWGDASLALVKSSPVFEDIEEWTENNTAYCKVKRKNQSEQMRSFSIEQAQKANLWGRQGPWTNYPERMLQMRARGFALRDVFPDVLKGLILAEEAIDLPREDYKILSEEITPPGKGVAGLKQHLGLEQKSDTVQPVINPRTSEKVVIEPEIKQPSVIEGRFSPAFEELKTRMQNAKSHDELNEILDLARELPEQERKDIKTLSIGRNRELREMNK